MLIDSTTSQLLIIDVQEKLLPAMHDPDGLLQNVRRLREAADMLEVPLAASEQYPRGLGPLIAPLAEALGADDAPLAKMEFSCARNPALRERLGAAGRRQVILCGIEAHVCVLQTAMDLATAESDVFVVADAVDSRAPRSRDVALDRMAAAGVHIVTTEMVVFEWIGTAEHPHFKTASKLIR